MTYQDYNTINQALTYAAEAGAITTEAATNARSAFYEAIGGLSGIDWATSINDGKEA